MAGYRSHKSFQYLFCVAAIVLLPALMVITGPGQCRVDALSSTTERFYGSVYNSGVLVSCGSVITAMIGATKVGQTTTDAQGRYGYSPVFEIPGSDGQMVNFTINGHPTIEKAVFQGGISKKLNLTAHGAASQMPSSSCSSCSSCYGTACSTSSWGITPTTFPYATAGYPYAVDLNAYGGSAPYTWTVSTGSLPPGLTMDSTLGSIKGVPSTPKLYGFTVLARDSASNYMTMATCILVNAAPSASESGGAQVITRTADVASDFLGTTDVVSVSGHTLFSDKELESEDRRVRLELVSGTALNLMGRNVIGAAKETNPPGADDGSLCLRSYSFTPAGATFTPAAIMTLKYDTPLPEGLDESGLYIAFWNGLGWTSLQSAVNTAAREVSAPVSHFTIFAIRGLPGDKTITAEPQDRPGMDEEASTGLPFTYSDLDITPSAAGPGQDVTVSVRVVNSSSSEITGDVVLEINRMDEIHKQVTLAAGGSKVIGFTMSREKSGKYTVGISQLSGVFEVDDDIDSGRTQRIPTDITLGIVGLAGLLIAIVLLRDIFRHRRER